MDNIANVLANVRQWGQDRNLTAPENLVSQTLKIMSELGEISQAWMTHNDAELRDGVGDVIIVAIIIGEQIGARITPDDVYGPKEGHLADNIVIALGLFADAVAKKDMEKARALLPKIVHATAAFGTLLGYAASSCLMEAYEEIKDRKGVMYNGVFIKEADPRYAEVMSLLGKA